MEIQAGIIRYIQSFHNPFFDTLFIIITNIGSEAFYFILIPFFYWYHNKKLGLKMAVTLLLSIYINLFLKELTAIARPIGYPGIRSLFVISAAGFSFPSGHAQGSATIWSILMAHYRSKAVYITGVALIFLVSLSRLYLGVHWPMDVLAGIVLGVLMADFASKIDNIKLPEKLETRLLSALIPFVLIAIFPHEDAFKYAGMLAGIMVGYNIEKAYVHFEPKKRTIKANMYILIVASVSFAVIYTGLKVLLPAGNISSMLRYFALGLLLTLGIPYIAAKIY